MNNVFESLRKNETNENKELEQAERIKREIVEITHGRQLSDLDIPELKKVLAKHKEIERELGIESKQDLFIKTKWKNPETKKKERIEIDFNKILAEQKEFYREKFSINVNETEARAIWQRNYAEIKKEMETCGYDSVLIVPENLPEEEILNQTIIETMDEAGKGKVAKTWQSSNFTEGRSFAGVINSYQPKLRIVLTHSAESLENNPILKFTKDKNIIDLTGLDENLIKEKIAKNEEMKVDCKLNIGGQELDIKAEGLSLEEYILFQRMYFDKNQKHLDENDCAWLLKSYSGSRVVHSYWLSDSRRLIVGADDPGNSLSYLGVRLSRSFS